MSGPQAEQGVRMMRIDLRSWRKQIDYTSPITDDQMRFRAFVEDAIKASVLNPQELGQTVRRAFQGVTQLPTHGQDRRLTLLRDWNNWRGIAFPERDETRERLLLAVDQGEGTLWKNQNIQGPLTQLLQESRPTQEDEILEKIPLTLPPGVSENPSNTYIKRLRPPVSLVDQDNPHSNGLWGLDEANFKIYSPTGVEIGLQPNEVLVLSLLFSNPDSSVRLDDVYTNSTWQGERDKAEVRKTIYNLRVKLKEFAGNRLITLTGSSYYLRVLRTAT